MNTNQKQLKIAIVHDHLAWGGGGERTALIMASELGADFITAYASPDTFPDYQKKLDTRLIILAKKVIDVRGLRFFAIRFIYWRHRQLLKNYDVLIASGQSAMEAVAFYGRADASKILYNHTQPRRVYDLYKQSKEMYPVYLQPLFSLFAWAWKKLYLKALLRIDVNIANSQNVQKRALKYTDRDVNYVVWPPILTEKFQHLEDGDYFLSWARVDEAKRVEQIVEAFQKMPEQKLIIASGGPRLEKVKAMSKDYPNIQVLGWISDTKLFDLVGKCRAAIYIPIDEDAGMTPLEANAAGKPVLGVSEGGLKETIIDGQTGKLIKADPKSEDIIEAVKKMTPEWCQTKKENCIQNARQYDQTIFIDKIKKIIDEHDPRKPIVGIDASRWDDPRFPGECRRTGVEVYVYNLIKALVPAILNHGLRVRLYTQRSIKSLPSAYQKVLPRQKSWTRILLNNELKSSRVSCFFTPAYYIPRQAPTASFATIHDIIFKSNPEKYSFLERLKQDYIAKLNLKRAKGIVTVSEHTRTEVIKYYNFPPENIISAPMGSVSFPPINDKIARENLIVYIGRIEKKKSVDVLVKAFALLKKKYPDWQLALAGMDGHGAEEIDSLIKELKLETSIKKLGYISEDEKYRLLNRAAMLVHPSSAEGSCFPMFEAWSQKTPCVVADTPLFKEIGEGASLFFEAGNERDLCKQMELLINNQNIYDKIISTGTSKLADMSWDKTAQKIISHIIS